MCGIQEFALYLLVKKSLPRFDFSSMKKQLRVLSAWKSLITLCISSDEIPGLLLSLVFEVLNSQSKGMAFPMVCFKLLAPPSGCNCSQCFLTRQPLVVSVISLSGVRVSAPHLLENLHFSLHFLEVRGLGT